MAENLLAQTYRRVEGCLEERMDDDVLVYNPENGSATQLNSASQLVWSLCDGQRRVRQIVRFIKEEYPDAGDEVRQDVVQVVRKLRRQGLVEQVET